ncbi:MAG: DUF4118 domain-containing protein, partial [Planctomycetes bacterium]|nr:DUF4118 domain-containing protein [Planctomycetota bacterium]
IGVVESHGREETERLCDGLERSAPQRLEHRGREFTEFDLDAVLARSPAVVLVDELAHRNIPGTRHPRRYQDIQELLDNGVEVWTTLNVQHLDSVNDGVARITGVRMRETVPDSLLEQARDIVLVDLSPRALQERLRQGKVYVPEQARAALDGFFSEPNLTALREMAFAAAANRVDADLRAVMRAHGERGPWPARERVVAAIDGEEHSERVVRAARRIAERSRAPWTVVYVDRGRGRAPARQQRLDRAFDLAERLGAVTAVLRGARVDQELLAFAASHNATTVVIGRTHERAIAGLFGQTLTQRLLRRNSDFELVMVGAEPVAATSGDAPPRWADELRGAPAHHHAVALLAVAASVAVSVLLERLLPLPVGGLSMVFLTGVLVVAARTSLAPALLAAALGFLAYNFFFTEPRYTFAMHRTGDVVTVSFFLVMAVIGSKLADRLRVQMGALRATNEHTQQLLALNRQLATAADATAVHRIAVEAIAAFEGVPACVLVPADDGLVLAA